MMDLPPTAQVWMYEETEQKPRHCSPEEMDWFEEYKSRKRSHHDAEIQKNVTGLAHWRKPNALEIWMCEANEGNSDRDIYSRDDSDTRMDSYWENYCSKKSTKAVKEMGLALGWAAAGQLDRALEHGVEALRQQTEAVIDSSIDIFDSAKDFFNKD